MKCLKDVSLLAACAWSTHGQHTAANRWLDAQVYFATCPASEMGFLRVSMSPAYGAAFDEANAALNGILQLPSHHFLQDDTTAERLPRDLTSRHDVTDAHFVTLASRHFVRLATLDDVLCNKDWAKGVALNPLKSELSGGA